MGVVEFEAKFVVGVPCRHQAVIVDVLIAIEADVRLVPVSHSGAPSLVVDFSNNKGT
jgi:hypothetical protein